MKKFLNVLAIVCLSFALIISPLPTNHEYLAITTQAHSGRTDSNVGHKDNKNKSGLGSYHYHCDGYAPHLHTGGKCPYAKSDSSSSSKEKSSKDSSKAKTNKSEAKSPSKNTIKQVQKALNKLGYDCGKADGVLGKKTKSELKRFQKDNDLTVDGIIGKQVKKALDIK